VSVVAVKNEDVAFFPRLHHNPSVSDHYVWFTFDDRTLYKPNETVNVKGYIRHLKHEKDTVIPQFCKGDVEWTVRNNFLYFFFVDYFFFYFFLGL
jgi:hypothetical protein